MPLDRHSEIPDRSCYTVTDGIMRWNTNNRVPPKDIVDNTWTVDSRINVPACDAARHVETMAVIEEYRAAQKNRTPEQIAEERFEARATHGPGVRLVDIVTGETYIT